MQCKARLSQNLKDLCVINDMKLIISNFADIFKGKDRKIIKLLLKQYDIISIIKEGFSEEDFLKPYFESTPYIIEYQNKFINQYDYNYPSLPEERFYWEFYPTKLI